MPPQMVLLSVLTYLWYYIQKNHHTVYFSCIVTWNQFSFFCRLVWFHWNRFGISPAKKSIQVIVFFFCVSDFFPKKISIYMSSGWFWQRGSYIWNVKASDSDFSSPNETSYFFLITQNFWAFYTESSIMTFVICNSH